MATEVPSNFDDALATTVASGHIGVDGKVEVTMLDSSKKTFQAKYSTDAFSDPSLTLLALIVEMREEIEKLKEELKARTAKAW